MTRIWLVADDYGISRSVNRAIRDLLAIGRLNATSVMVVTPGFDRQEARLLADVATTSSAAIGLHLTLTAPFRPLSDDYRPTQQHKFLSLGRTFAFGKTGRLSRAAIAAEVRAQLAAFIAAFGRPPDFIDGHQHVHLLAPVADNLLAVMHEAAPDAWVRQCGRGSARAGFDRKALILDLMSRSFRRRAARHGVRTNPAFAGTYDFNAATPYENLFPAFLDGMPEGGLIMCHPGIVDDTLAAVDPLTTQREREYRYFKSEAFTAALAERDVTLH